MRFRLIIDDIKPKLIVVGPEFKTSTASPPACAR